MFGSRVASGLELRLPELGRHQALRIETGRDQHGGIFSCPDSQKFLLTTRKGSESYRLVSLGQKWVPRSDKESGEKPGGQWAQLQVKNSFL